MVKQGLALQQKLSQKLSPLQLQIIGLIQIPTVELGQRIQKEIEENPVLEQVEDSTDDDATRNVSLSEIGNDDQTPSYRLYVNNQGKDLKPEYNTFQAKESFQQSLLSQLGYVQLDDRRRKAAGFIIGMIGDDGYLRRDMASLADDIAFKTGLEFTEDELEDILGIIQEFEPAGVGARDLRECLLLQLKARTQTPAVELAAGVLEDYFEEFAKKHYDRISSKMGITSGQLKEAVAEIRKLNPAPGGQIDDSYSDQAQQVIPDFLLERNADELTLSLPRYSIPELRINRRYAETLMDAARSSSRAGKEAEQFVKQKVDSAKWFIEAVKQRYNTLYNTMSAILDFQHDFFMDGDETLLRPMVLKNIAEKTGYDISTISRVASSKYIQTHFGIYPLKYFFSEGMTNNEGEEVSTREIKKILQQSIGEEDKSRPLTDEQLMKLLDTKGYKVARRTVAKYREQLSIPIARLRREI